MTCATKPVDGPHNSIQPRSASEAAHPAVRDKGCCSLQLQALSLQNLIGNEVRIEITATYSKQTRGTNSNRQ
jgi:hypothetical protein